MCSGSPPNFQNSINSSLVNSLSIFQISWISTHDFWIILLTDNTDKTLPPANLWWRQFDLANIVKQKEWTVLLSLHWRALIGSHAKKGHSWIESNFGQMPLPTVTCMGHCKHQTWVYLETVHHINHRATDPYSYSINTKGPMLAKPLKNAKMDVWVKWMNTH